MNGSRSGPTRWAAVPRLPLVLAGAAVLIVVLVVVFAHGAHTTATAQPSAPPAPAGTFRPSDEQWRGLSFATVGAADFPVQEDTDGQIASDDDVTVQVLPPFSGQVREVFVKAGDAVSKGQPLASVNAAEFAQARTDLATAAANLTAARAALNTSAANAARQQALFKINGAATRDVQQSASDLAAAQGTVRSDEGALRAVRDRLRILGYDDAQVARLQAGTPDNAQGPAAVVRAPISGVITQRQVGPGQYLNATSNGATTPIFVVSDLSKVWLVANAREADIDKMKTGQPVQVTVDALPGRTFDARVSFVGPAIDPTTRRLSVRATLANPGGLLKPGMYANFVIQSGAGETAPAVPEAAVIYEGDTARVWIANPDHTLALRQIKAGRTRGGMVEALQGLSAGDKVVVAGALFIDRASRPD